MVCSSGKHELYSSTMRLCIASASSSTEAASMMKYSTYWAPEHPFQTIWDAPGRCGNDGVVDRRADVWGLGGTLQAGWNQSRFCTPPAEFGPYPPSCGIRVMSAFSPCFSISSAVSTCTGRI